MGNKLVRATDLYHEAADERGSIEAMRKLAEVYNRDEDVHLAAPRWTLALRYYHNASEVGHGGASGELAMKYKWETWEPLATNGKTARYFKAAKLCEKALE